MRSVIMDIVIISNDKKSKEILKQHILEIDSTANISLFNENIDLKHELTHFNKHTIFFIYLSEPFSNGIHIAKTISHYFFETSIIFVSSSLQASRYIYDVNHCYFIYEPDLKDKLLAALNKAANNNQRIAIVNKGKTSLIPCSDIIFFERDLRQTIIHLEDKTIKTYENLKKYDEQTGPHFLECHRSFLVNLSKVIEYHRTYFIMSNGLHVPISRSHEKHTKTIFEQYFL
ncbi:hypothetical protein DWZ53_05615 [Coprobacillus sp. AF33-1AC]|nr:hypothetical protein DWZ53_05615 [Coprobacillus sp. AF33-1AC]